MHAIDTTELEQSGLNLFAVMNLADLPADLRASMAPQVVDGAPWRQLILLGHAGRQLWQAVQASGISGGDPIDRMTVDVITRWFQSGNPGHRMQLLYPGDQSPNLQRLGELAGWHHPSPFMLGIRPGWGTWFAYRAVLLTDTEFPPTPPLQEVSPCEACALRSCVGACPAGALASDSFQLDKCITYRKRADSLCRATCLARLACPVGAEHRYCEAQMRHTYSISMAAIEAYC